MNRRLDTALLYNYMHNFFGYGNLKGKFWFVGMEEGGGEKIEEIESKLNKWAASNSGTLLDLYEFHKDIINNKNQKLDIYFKNEKSKYQRTWGGLIKVILAYKGKSILAKNAKPYQSQKLGRINSENCITEVFPLPSPSTNKFNYNEWTDIPYLKNREAYKNELKEPRTKKLSELIHNNKPKFVIFYSTNQEYQSYWSSISEVDFFSVRKIYFAEKSEKKLFIKMEKKNDITYVIMHHPTYPGVTNNYLKWVGEKLNEI